MNLLLNNKMYTYLIIGIMSLGFMNSLLYADIPKSKKSNGNTIIASRDTTATIKGNNVSISMNNRGAFVDYHVRGDSGLTLGKTTAYSDAGVGSMFQGHLWVSGINSSLSDSLVAVIGDYTDDMHAGEWGSDPTDLKYRIYTVNINMLTQPELYTDFQNWPTDQGAPWVDVDGNGTYNPLPNGVDHPKFYGDTVSWYVSADGDRAHKLNTGTQPTDLEFQTTVYSFNRPTKAPKYDNVIFYRVLLVNKGDDTLKEVYAGIWADTDLGDETDDLVGVDVSRSMAYTYNDGADSKQTAYYNQPEQSVVLGIDLLQGPMMDCSADGFIDIILTAIDLDGDPVSISIVDAPQFGTIEYRSGSQQTSGTETQTTWRYTPSTNYIGKDSFTYTGMDESDTSNIGTVGISVTDAAGENQPAMVYPNGGESLVPGRSYNLLWRRGNLTASNNDNMPVTFESTQLELFKGGSNIDILVGNNTSTTNSLGSSWTWTIPTTITRGTDYQIRLRNMTGGEVSWTDLSDQYFTIAPVTLTSPNGGENWEQGSTHNITWDGDFIVDTGIQLYKGTTQISELTGSVGKGINFWSWAIPDTLTPGTDYQIRIYDTGSGEEQDYSNDFFSITTSTGRSNSSERVNQAPTVTDQSLNAIVNESCGSGAQMFGEIHPTKKNLSLSSFSFMINGDATYNDPSGAIEARNRMKGLKNDGTTYPLGIGGELYDQKFVFYGDPTSAAGHSNANPVDGNYASSADRRFTMNIGPFTMAPSDSQEVVFAIIHDFGSSPLTAIDSLKVTDNQLQTDYDDRFSVFNVTSSASVSLQSSVTSGYAPLSVSFDGSNSSPLEAMLWDFNNDGTTDSKSFTPTYVFATPGEYKVKLDMKFKDFVNGYSTLSTLSDSLVINVLSPNPVVQDKSYTVNEDTATTITLTGSDPQGAQLTYQIEQAPSNAIASLSGASLSYTPNENFVGQDSIKYSASNADYKSNIGTILIQVNAVDDDPTTFDVTATTDEDTAVDINFSAEEYDGDAYSFTIKQSPSHGTLGTISGSTVTYSPNSDWFGIDTFTYEAADDRFAKINIATAAITVNPINDAPTTNDMSIASYEDLETTIPLDINDVDGDNLTHSIVTDVSNGSTSLSGSTVTYIPNENYNGSDSFTFTTNDGVLASNTSTASITLSAVNDASSDFTTSEDYIVNSSDGQEWIITTNNLIANPQNEQDSLQFNWEESFDIDGDQIQYRMIGYDALEFLTMDNWMTDLTLSWSIKDLVSYTDTVNVASGSWVIVATDGEFFKESNFGNPMELFINGSALVPDEYILNQNYPNPFSSSTTITYDMPETQKVMIRIFDIKGRLIRTLANEDQNAGYKTVIWDGKNDDGDQVSAGIYFYQMHAPSSLNFNGLTKTKKMIKLD